MSEGYARDRPLVAEGSPLYDRALDATIALTVVTFLLGLLTLVAVVPLDAAGPALVDTLVVLLGVGAGATGTVGLLSFFRILPISSRRVRGVGLGLPVVLVALTAAASLLPVTAATLLGGSLLVEAGVVLAAGVASRTGAVATDPSATPGLLAGAAFGLVGGFIGAALGATVLPGGSYVPALLGAVALGCLTVLPREDVGTVLPVAVLVGTLGLVVAAGLVGPGWSWSPGSAIDGDFTGAVVVPLFVLAGSVVAAWGAAKSRAGFGAVGRQYGAYLVVYLNALVMVAIMLSIVAFVAFKGLAYAVHGFTVGAASALVALAPIGVVVLNWARTPAGTADWHSGARQLFRALPVAAVGGAAGLLAVVGATGSPLEIPFTYTVWVNRQPQALATAARITPEPTVGTLLVILAGLFLAWYCWRRYGGLRGVGTHDDRVAALERWLGIGVGLVALLVVVLALGGPAPGGVPLADTAGLVVVTAGAPAGAALSLWALGSLLTAPDGVAATARDRAQSVRVGLLGGLALLVAAAVVQSVAVITPRVGPMDLVPAAAFASLAGAAGVALATGLAARAATDSTARLLRRESALGLVGVAGAAVVVALHVALTGVPVTIGGLTIADTGTLSWPMTMDAYIPLGPEPGGIMPAVVGTIWLVVGAALFAVPLGVGAAVFLTEYAEQGRFTAVVEIATNSLWSTPSVVFGLFGAAFLIPRLGGDESLLAGMLVLGFMLLPLVVITSREAIKSVPDEYRDASAALGVSQWETIKTVVLPAALPGVITGVILGIGRIAGETAPLILVLGSTLNATAAVDVLGGFEFVGHPPFVANPTLLEASAALPTQVWAVIAAGVSGSPSMGWASALVLLGVVLSFYAVGIVARTHFRRKLDYE